MRRNPDRRDSFLVLANNFPPDHGGIQRFMHRIADELAARADCEVVVVAPHAAGADAFDESQRFDVARTNGSGLRGLACFLKAAIDAALKHRIAATVASIWYPTGLVGALLPRTLRGRLVVLAHGSEIAPSRRGVRRLLMHFVFARADVVAANSSYTRRLLVDAGISKRVTVVPCGVDPAPHTIDRRSDEPMILTVGRLVARKGLDLVIRAVALLRTDIPSLSYVIIGAGPDEQRLRDIARVEGVADCVQFCGALSDAELRSAYERAWCFAMPARRIVDDVEGFGIVYLEAAIMGLPSIGSRDSGAIDAIIDGITGLLVNGEDVNEVASALRQLLSDTALVERMGRAARARALRLTWRDSVNMLYMTMVRSYRDLAPAPERLEELADRTVKTFSRDRLGSQGSDTIASDIQETSPMKPKS